MACNLPYAAFFFPFFPIFCPSTTGTAVATGAAPGESKPTRTLIATTIRKDRKKGRQKLRVGSEKIVVDAQTRQSTSSAASSRGRRSEDDVKQMC